MDIQELLKLTVEKKGSDLHLATGLPPLIRIDGEIQKTDLPALSEDELKKLIYSMMAEKQQKEYEENWENDFAIEAKGLARFRVNAYHDQRGPAAALRPIPAKVRSFEEIGAPDVFKEICNYPRGIILVTGPTGSGKSTTLATMIDYVNTSRADHIITVEDPVEFVHESKKSLINQREVNRDTKSFAAALRSALREDPDVILVGEMRDLETIRLALTAAETGHLVFGTLHTSSAAKTVDRVIDVFPGDEKEMVRAMLSESLRAVISTLIKLIVAISIMRSFGAFIFILIPSISLSLLTLYKGTQWYLKTRGEAWQLSDKVTMRIHDSLANTKIIRPLLQFEMNSLEKILSQEAIRWYHTTLRQHAIPMVISLIMGGTLAWIVYNGASAVQNQSLSLGEFVLLKGQLIAIFLPLKTLTLEFRQMAEAVIDIQKIAHFLATPFENKHLTQIHMHEKSHPKSLLVLDQVSFNYDEPAPLLENISFTIFEGEKILIVGENGSGKSSLMGLLAGLHKPTTGMIRSFASKTDTFSHHTSPHISFIPQDARLFNLSLKDNLTYGISQASNISEKKLTLMLEAVGLAPLLFTLPQGLDTLLGDFGFRLSGGEKQRLLLARALLAQPKMLLLDEALNAVNIEAEKKIAFLYFFAYSNRRLGIPPTRY